MYKNLLAEIARAELNKTERAKILNISVNALRQKLSGKTSFSLNECLKIKSALANNKLALGYLFLNY